MPGFNVDSLKAVVASWGGFAVGSKYDVMIIPRDTSTIPAISTLHDLRFLCESTSLPVRSLATVDSQIYGPPTKMPYQSTYTEAAFSFYLTEFMAQKKIFDDWLDKIINPRTGNVSFFDQYSCTIEIRKFSRRAESPNTDSPDYSVKLIDAFP
ncbi:MAG: hypothetical protein QGH83_04935, partial [Candidatus Pacebacteria bacterium]|nr:hypothetical protein [Candidatus Paceibacterota bacterium]